MFLSQAYLSNNGTPLVRSSRYASVTDSIWEMCAKFAPSTTESLSVDTMWIIPPGMMTALPSFTVTCWKKDVFN